MRVDSVSGNIHQTLNKKPINVSFGSAKGLSIVVTPELYFGESLFKDIKEGKLPDSKTNVRFSDGFVPYRRLSEISPNKKSENAFQIITAIEQNISNKFMNFFSNQHLDNRRTIWLPDIVAVEDTGRCYNHINRCYELDDRYMMDSRPNSVKFSLVKQCFKELKKENKQGLVIAIGSQEKDLEFINPFNYKNLQADYKNFNEVKDFPFHGAFLYNDQTSKNLLDKVRNIEKICNADGNVRFIVIPDKVVQSRNPVVQAALILQKEFARRYETYRNSISDKMIAVLENTRLEYHVTKSENTGVKYNPIPLWTETSNVEKKPLFKRILNYAKNNKIACSLALASIAIPVYFKIDNSSENTKSLKVRK